jgi:hypothetical protein
MTVDEFQKRYHDYKSTDAMEALSDALKLRVVDEDGKERKVVPMKFGDKWCLMIDTAAATVIELGLDSLSKNEKDRNTETS